MTKQHENVILIDLPVFPKGVISLSLLLVARCFSKTYNVKIIDLNFAKEDDNLYTTRNTAMYGLKVSSQSLPYAITITEKIKRLNPSSKIIWGGELPSLLPELCLQYAHSIVQGLFEPIAERFITDLQANQLQAKYHGDNSPEQTFTAADFSLLPHADKYYQFMGYPMETSRGCTEKCIFCMVHTMQKKNYNLKALDSLKENIAQYKNKFINVVDYNFGVNERHVVEVAQLIKDSGAIGWMAEMCIELLDNERLLQALKDSRCKMIYCGLESIDQSGLKSVHKMNTNHVENYERIIRKVQQYEIQVAAGVILGLEGTHENTFDELFKFYQRMGIIYAKLTFLTYNPGTKAHEYEKKKGVYLTENIENYDGNQLTFLPAGLDADYIAKGTKAFIKKYYSGLGIINRSFNSTLSFWSRLEFILFNICYREVYFQWLRLDTLNQPNNLKFLIEKPFKKSRLIQLAEKTLHWVRIKQIKD